MAHPLRRIVKKTLFYLCASLLIAVGIGAFFGVRQKPEYCWLVFGPNGQARVLLCLSGDAISLDHYANGKATGRIDRFQIGAEFKNIEVTDPDGTTSYVITKVQKLEVPAGAHAELMVNVEIEGPVSYHQYCDVPEMADGPAKAPLSHFHGPLTVEVRKTNFEINPGLSLKRGDTPTNIFAVVGTMDAHKGCWVVVSTQGEAEKRMFPEDVHPIVDVEFPSQNDADPPIRRRYPLDRVC